MRVSSTLILQIYAVGGAGACAIIAFPGTPWFLFFFIFFFFLGAIELYWAALILFRKERPPERIRIARLCDRKSLGFACACCTMCIGILIGGAFDKGVATLRPRILVALFLGVMTFGSGYLLARRQQRRLRSAHSDAGSAGVIPTDHVES